MEASKLCYSVAEAAVALGVGRNTMYSLCARDDFPAIRLGERRIVVPVQALTLWLEKQGDFNYECY